MLLAPEGTPEHKQKEVDKAVRDSMRKAGITDFYHDQRLSNFGDQGDRLTDWVKNNVQDVRSHSAGLGFVGGDRARKLTIMTARSLHLMGTTVHVLALPRLIQALRGTNDREMDGVANASAIFVVDAYQPAHTAPFTAFERADCEAYLIERMENRSAVFTHSTDRIVADSGWWTPSLVETLNTFNEEWTV